MPIFIGVHDMGQEVSEDMMKSSWEKYKQACKNHNAEAWKAYGNAKLGRGYCITEAPSAKEVNDAHAEADVPVNEVIEVQKLQ